MRLCAGRKPCASAPTRLRTHPPPKIYRVIYFRAETASIRNVDDRFAALRNRYILDRADRLSLGALNASGSLKAYTSPPPHLYKCGGGDVYAFALLFGKLAEWGVSEK